MRDIVILACTECKRRNYTTTKNKRKTPDRLELKKYCRWCRAHKPHRETKKRVREYRPVAQLVEHRSPKPGAGGSSPSWPAKSSAAAALLDRRRDTRS